MDTISRVPYFFGNPHILGLTTLLTKHNTTHEPPGRGVLPVGIFKGVQGLAIKDPLKGLGFRVLGSIESL